MLLHHRLITSLKVESLRCDNKRTKLDQKDDRKAMDINLLYPGHIFRLTMLSMQ